MAEKLNMAKGPTALVLPLQGMGHMIGGLSSPEWDKELLKGWAGFRQTIKRSLKNDIRFIEMDTTFNDPLYTRTVLELFDEMGK